MKKLPQFNPSDEKEMRAFYASCGVSESTTEAAIKLRLSAPVEEPKKPSPIKGKPKRKQQATARR
jgi:hypothetical protein